MRSYVLKVRCGRGKYVQRDGRPGTGGRGPLIEEEVSFTVAATQDQTLFDGTGGEYVVRRITPTEAERLQGMPDGHTDLTGCDVDAVTDRVAASLGYDEAQRRKLRTKVARWSKATPDTPRYKAIGNSFAVPVVRWLGERIQMVDGMASDG